MDQFPAAAAGGGSLSRYRGERTSLFLIGHDSMDPSFIPPFLLRNPHLQTVLSSLKIRTLRDGDLDRYAREVLIDAGNGVRLLGYHTRPRAGASRGLLLLLHGWEGSSSSAYMLATGGFFHREGYDVFRLNLRDHGDSHHLNEGLFNSSMIEETHRAVQKVADANGPLPLSIVGFSLGGNFSLRMALRHCRDPIPNLRQVAAISPVLDPLKATQAIDRGPSLYRSYFLKKWKRSLRRKQSLFPRLYDFEYLMGYRTCMEITDLILPRYSPFSTSREYFQTYTLTGRSFSELTVPVRVLTAADDPIIPAADFRELRGNSLLQVRVEPYGGHCGFLRDYLLRSWLEDFLRRAPRGGAESPR